MELIYSSLLFLFIKEIQWITLQDRISDIETMLKDEYMSQDGTDITIRSKEIS